MSDEPPLVDTNVLVYAFFEEAEHHHSALRLLHEAQDREVALCIAPQVLAEFYAVITDARRVTAPYRPEEALEIMIDEILAMPGMSLLSVPGDIVNRWAALLKRHPVTRGAVFDAQLVATMLANGVSRIYTYDRSHFERFEELEVLTP